MMAMETPTKWKSGDVAMVTARWVYSDPHTARRATRLGKQWESSNGALVNDHEVSLVRPLVVIDPEDAEQVERLLRLWVNTNPDDAAWLALVDNLTTALREFANPTPRIEEPLGLGAVVETETGRRYVRTYGRADEADYECWKADILTSRCRYSEIPQPVRVLSHGVTEGES